ncbi:hypothetical protein TNCV_1637671 [Trichonephila clavipes]|nr:hypothetical protein TNCV_1637671 [Trichonephila clavipes]
MDGREQHELAYSKGCVACRGPKYWYQCMGVCRFNRKISKNCSSCAAGQSLTSVPCSESAVVIHDVSPSQGLLAIDLVILNYGQVTRTTPDIPPLPTTTPQQREDFCALDRLTMHLFPTQRVFSGIRLELMTH